MHQIKKNCLPKTILEVDDLNKLFTAKKITITIIEKAQIIVKPKLLLLRSESK